MHILSIFGIVDNARFEKSVESNFLSPIVATRIIVYPSGLLLKSGMFSPSSRIISNTFSSVKLSTNNVICLSISSALLQTPNIPNAIEEPTATFFHI